MERDDRMDRLPPRDHDREKAVEFRRAKPEDIPAILSILEFDVPGGLGMEMERRVSRPTKIHE